MAAVQYRWHVFVRVWPGPGRDAADGVVHAAPHPRDDADAHAFGRKFIGEVEVDETFVGVKAQNRRGNAAHSAAQKRRVR